MEFPKDIKMLNGENNVYLFGIFGRNKTVCV